MPAKVQISRCKTCPVIISKAQELNDAIKKKCPDAVVETTDGPKGSFEVKVNGNTAYTRPKDAAIPSFDDILKKVEEASKK